MVDNLHSLDTQMRGHSHVRRDTTGPHESLSYNLVHCMSQNLASFRVLMYGLIPVEISNWTYGKQNHHRRNVGLPLRTAVVGPACTLLSVSTNIQFLNSVTIPELEITPLLLENTSAHTGPHLSHTHRFKNITNWV